jgi:hypothetical protein
VSDLETLKTVTSLSLLTDNIKHRVNELGNLSVMSFSPVVTSTALPKDEVIGTEKAAKGAR